MSMSISNQKIMLGTLLKAYGCSSMSIMWMTAIRVPYFNRPAFQRMIADIEAGKIGCVITKTYPDLVGIILKLAAISIFFPNPNTNVRFHIRTAWTA